MIDKTHDITLFFKKHFTPGTLEDYTFFKTNHGVLNMLFDVFPEDCIDTYELHEIMTSLGYEPIKRTVTEELKKDSKKKPKITVGFYWCLKSV